MREGGKEAGKEGMCFGEIGWWWWFVAAIVCCDHCFWSFLFLGVCRKYRVPLFSLSSLSLSPCCLALSFEGRGLGVGTQYN